ncbi:MAG: helix-turn-helix domain-containing protein [Parasporobacterium sp.]|nr:helix-turn-helix domain-containing protein [Parasporobacterium sp.]
MLIGDVIRKYRKQVGITQEEMAKRLGVTTPAVNKWENNNTQPDIALLAPIARLLGITTDTLLSFRDSLSSEEIAAFVKKLDQDLETREYAEVFAEVKKTLEEYPNCDQLIWQAAVILQARRNMNPIPGKEKYDDVIFGWLERCLQSEDANIRKEAAGSLFYAYLQKEEYEKAHSYLSYLAVDSPERKRKEAVIFSRTGKKEEAYRAYEELLFTNYQFISLVLNDLRILYMEDGNRGMAWKLVDVQNQAAKVFEMGRYNEVSTGLDVASWEKDVPKTAEIMREILAAVDHISDFSQSPLYQHMAFKDMDPGFTDRLHKNLIEGMHDESYSYMRGNEFWEETLKKGLDSPLRSEDTLASDSNQTS